MSTMTTSHDAARNRRPQERSGSAIISAAMAAGAYRTRPPSPVIDQLQCENSSATAARERRRQRHQHPALAPVDEAGRDRGDAKQDARPR